MAGDKRRRRAIQWTWPPPGDPAAVPFAARPRPIARYLARLRAGLVVRPRLTGTPPDVPHTGYPAIIPRRPRPRPGLVLQARFPSPGDPTPTPVLRGIFVPPRIRLRPGQARLAVWPTPGNISVDTPWQPILRIPRPGPRRGVVVRRLPWPSDGDPDVGPPPPRDYTVRAPDVRFPPRLRRRGQWRMVSPFGGNVTGMAMRPTVSLRRSPPRRGLVIAPRLAPYVLTQPTPPFPRVRALPRMDRRRPGLVVLPRLLRPLGGGTPIRGKVVTPPRRPARRGAVLRFVPVGSAATQPAMPRPRPISARPRPRPGLVVRQRRLAVGDINRAVLVPELVRLARVMARPGLVLHPALPWQTAPLSLPLSPARSIVRPAAARPGLVIRPRAAAAIAADESPLFRPRVVAPPHARRPGARPVHRMLFGITPAGTLPPPRSLIAVRPTRPRPGLSLRPSWPLSSAAWQPSELPDPYAATGSL